MGTVPNVDDAKEFKNVCEAFSLIGISVTEQWNLFINLASILHLGNISFKGDLQKNDPALEKAASLMHAKVEDLYTLLTERKIVTRSESINVKLKAEEGAALRDSIARWIYGECFEWIVSKCNDMLKGGQGLFIGVLDIYGFEHFEKNGNGFISNSGFEQFCINYANEKLQAAFNVHVFHLEQQVQPLSHFRNILKRR